MAEFGVTDSTTNHDREKVRKASIKVDIEKDKEWAEILKVYSATNNISIDEVYDIEVQNILNNEELIKDSTSIDEKAIFNYEVKQLIERWKNNPKMMGYLKEKANKKGQPLEKVILDDARWVINQKKSK